MGLALRCNYAQGAREKWPGLYSTWAKRTRKGFSFWELGDKITSRAQVTAQGEESKCEVCRTSVECGGNGPGQAREEMRLKRQPWGSLWNTSFHLLRTLDFQEMGSRNRVFKRPKMWPYLYFRNITLGHIYRGNTFSWSNFLSWMFWWLFIIRPLLSIFFMRGIRSGAKDLPAKWRTHKS